MLDRLEEIARKHADLLAQQADPEIAVDPNRSREVAQKLAELKHQFEESRAALVAKSKQQEDELLASQDKIKQAARLATLLKEDQKALEQQRSIAELTKEKLAAEEQKRRQAEQSVREAVATIASERAQRLALEKQAKQSEQKLAKLKQEFEESRAARITRWLRRKIRSSKRT